ncbi:TniQ family protein [Allomesorhizobium camelthorni]|uniref:TniQ domain-containing protein n=1 Tax=Allomesorhizobium camelthorni TaxID=475069 RepID=A0A6G4WAA6_9HYPH|nr:TniQ family protein [Mesorhizobium camelthorni]NGO51057.1 hypothetical protein [Mesorhizobium camelthorni]
MRLTLTLDNGDGETPSDFTSRLSARACRDSLRDFCLDFGLDAQGIIDGRAESVGRLADLAGVDQDGLLAEAFVRVGNQRRYKHKGQDLLWSSLLRSRVRMCPACMTEDIENLDCRIAARPHRRSIWIIKPIRTCIRHDMALAEIGSLESPAQLHDVSQVIASALPRLPHLLDHATRRTPSSLECYIVDRIAATAGVSWLDGFPLHAALHIAHVLGAVAQHGSDVVLDDLSDDALWQCEAAGFAIADRGETGILSLLDDLRERFRDSRYYGHGRKATYGRLYDWLAHENSDPAYDPLREIVFRHAVETMPLGPGERLLGREVVERRTHSIRSASLEFGLHPKRLRKLLRTAKLTGKQSDVLADDRVVFDAEAAEPFLRDLAQSMSLEEAREYLNVPRPHDRGLLERGLINPMITGGRSDGEHAFLRSDLDDLLERLLRNADPMLCGDTAMVPMITAAKHSCCAVMDIVALVLDGKLKRVGRDTSDRGFISVLVDAEEARPHVVGPAYEGHSLRELESLLPAKSRAVKALLEQGLLVAETVKNPVTGWMQPVVLPDELARFKSEFASLHILSREGGEHIRRVKKSLVAAGVHPVADPELLGQTLYRRSDLP